MRHLISETAKWLYVAEYDDGCVKVGISGHPRGRLAMLKRPWQIGRQTMLQSKILIGLELPNTSALCAEQAAISRLAALASRRVKKEWFYGVSYAEACKIAEEEAGWHLANPPAVADPAEPVWESFDMETDEVLAAVRDLGRNLAQLAVKSGVSVRALMAIRHDPQANPRLLTLVAIAKAIGYKKGVAL